MGFQTTLTILNDAIPAIEADPKGWWEKTMQEIQSHPGNLGSKSYGFGHHANGFAVAAMHHADVTSVIAVGGNHSTVLAQLYGQGHHSDETRLELMKKLADEMGYSLTKKRAKKVKQK